MKDEDEDGSEISLQVTEMERGERWRVLEREKKTFIIYLTYLHIVFFFFHDLFVLVFGLWGVVGMGGGDGRWEM